MAEPSARMSTGAPGALLVGAPGTLHSWCPSALHKRHIQHSQVFIWLHPSTNKAHSESAYDFPGPTPVPALLSRPFLKACYHSALTTSSASATAPASAPVAGDCSPAPSLRSSCTLGNKASRILHLGALQCGVARLAMGAPRMRYVVWRARCSG